MCTIAVRTHYDYIRTQYDWGAFMARKQVSDKGKLLYCLGIKWIRKDKDLHNTDTHYDSRTNVHESPRLQYECSTMKNQ